MSPTKPDPEVLVDVRDLHVHFALQTGFLARLFGRGSQAVRAVDGVDLQLRRGEVLGLVGESGSGKTTLGRALLGLVRPTSGSVHYQGADLARLPERALRRLRRRLQMVFQDPHASLNPSMDIEHAVGHPLRIHRITRSAEETRGRVVASLDRVGLAPVDRFLGKFPADLSGGQKQRAVIARAIILEPELLVADEPVSMLDMSVRAKILELMLDLRRDLNLTYVYITHDLATAKFCCDRVAIMYLGRVVEIGPTAEIFANPRHPYTQALLRAVPEPDPRRTVPRDLPRGEVPDAARPPHGCSFHPRCPVAFEVCGWEGRDLRALLEARWTRLGEPTYEAEAAVVGDLAGLEQTGEQLRLRPAGGHRAEELLGVLTALRADDPTERFWTGVTDLRLVDGAVVVQLRPGVDPGLLAAGPVRVACHLHDPALRPASLP